MLFYMSCCFLVKHTSRMITHNSLHLTRVHPHTSTNVIAMSMQYRPRNMLRQQCLEPTTKTERKTEIKNEFHVKF